MFGKEKLHGTPHLKVVVSTADGSEYTYEYEEGGAEVKCDVSEHWLIVYKSEGGTARFPVRNLLSVEEDFE